MSTFWQDLRYGLRLLARSPWLTAAAVVSLALGVGVNTSIFSIVKVVLFRELPVEDPASLVDLFSGEEDGTLYGPLSYPDFLDLRDHREIFSDLAGHSTIMLNYLGGDRPETLLGEIVTANYFSFFGIRAALGRTFLPEEGESPGAHPVVVVSHGFWQRRLAADPAVVGRELKLNGHTFTVVGVAPPQFQGMTVGLSTTVWVPIEMHDQVVAPRAGRLSQREARWLFAKSRLAEGVTLDQARSRVATLAGNFEQAYPESNRGRRISLVPTSQVSINPQVDGAIFGVAGFLMLVVGFVLLIAAANIANLLLARGTARRREIALRLAIGASRAQVVRQLLLESVVLALLAGAVGVLVAYWMVRLIVGFEPPMPIVLALEFGLDGRVLLFTLCLSILTGVLCGLAPALKSTTPDLASELKDEVTSSLSGYRKIGLRNLLVVGQVAVSSLLLVVAGLFLRSLQNAQAVDTGFGTREAVIVTLQPDLAGYSEAEAREFYREVVERVGALPGVRSATLTDWLPLSLGLRTKEIFIDGGEPAPDGGGFDVDTSIIGTDYLDTLRIPLIAGRDFSSWDDESAAGVAIVNQTLAQRFWPGESAIGKRLSTKSLGGPFLEVIGVAKDGKYRTLGEAPRPYLYLPLQQNYAGLLTNLVAQTEGDARDMVAVVRDEVFAVDGDHPIFEIKTLQQHLEVNLFPARIGAALLGAFGLLGLLLASVGLAGVVAYSMSRRTREMGIRIALGAQRGDVLRLVIGEAILLVGVGLVLGLGAAFAVTRVLSSVLVGIGAAEAAVFVGVSTLLIVVAFAASFLPARRAIQADPMEALRYG